MPLSPTVLVLEADIAAKLGATLSGTTYTVFGMTMTQTELQTNVNNQVNQELNLLGNDVYYAADPVLNGAVKQFQIDDCVYALLCGLPGRAATYFNFGSGDTRFDLNLSFLKDQTDRMKVERDRSFNQVQNLLSGGTMIDTTQPGYSQPSAPVY